MDALAAPQEPDAKEMTELLLRVMEGVNAQSFRRWGSRVLTGPFTGMLIPERTPWNDGNSSTKLLGTYEHELHEAIEYALWRQPQIVVNVGCAEGYYAIGFARKGLEVCAFDPAADSILLCEEYADLNRVAGMVLIQSRPTPEELRLDQYTVKGHRLYFFDCEGAEEDLIDLERCPDLGHSDIIVECHDFLKPGISCKLADRLAGTHRVELIKPKLPDLRMLERLPTAFGVLSVVEKRPMPCCWLACWANKQIYPKLGGQDG